MLWFCVAPVAVAQVWVAPRRPGQSIVRYADHDWQTVELLVGEVVHGEAAGGVRLFFYEEERGAAERAAAHLEQAYRELAEQFDYVPQKRFDYVVYGTYQEFLRTNLFPVQEGVLGATAPRGLEVALPYFGDHALFWHTSTHELAHEFTIQKVRDRAGDVDIWGDPVAVLPLWFIEGLAEYVALGPIEGENAMRVRDMVANPDLYTGHGLLEFWDDWPSYVLWTYAGGHARISFLEQTYGVGTAQKILDLAPAVLASAGLAGRINGFSRLVEEITEEDEGRVEARFDAWIKRRAFAEVLDAEQDFADFDPLERVAGIPLSLDADPSGGLLAYRSLSRQSGRTSIQVVDPRRPSATRRIVADRRPGVESLHPIDDRNFDLGTGRIAYVAESRGRDVLVVQALEHVARERSPEPLEPVRDGHASFDAQLRKTDPEASWRVRIKKGKKARYHLDRVGILSAGSVSLEPDGERIVVVGLGEDSTRDLWLITPRGRAFDARQLTFDVAAEHGVSWGPEGVVYGSDASADGRIQLFRLDPDGDGVPERLTTSDRDHLAPVALPEGPVVYSAYDRGAVQLFAFEDGEEVRLTDVPLGAFDPAPGPDGGLWTMVQHAGRLRPSLLTAEAMRVSADSTTPAAAGPPVLLPTHPLAAAQRYRPLKPGNWALDGGFAALGAGPGGVYGQLYLSASERLRDHALVLVASAYGTPELTDVQLIYLDQHARVTWGGGPFHQLRFRIDQSVPEEDLLFQSAERFYGMLGSLRYPLDRFVYLQFDQAVGGVSYFLLDGDEDILNNLGVLNAWERANPYPRWQSETTARIGVDTTRFHPTTGPVAGSTLLLEGTVGVQPFDEEQYASLRFDGQQYLPIPFVSGGNLSLRGSVATSGLGTYARGYWLSSYDTLRAFRWGDPRLLGRHYWFANTELQLPLDAVLRFALASSIEGVAGLDFGGVSDDVDQLWDERVLDGALGTNFILGPLVLRLHWARAIEVGGELPDTGVPWVTNFSISWLGL